MSLLSIPPNQQCRRYAAGVLCQRPALAITTRLAANSSPAHWPAAYAALYRRLPYWLSDSTLSPQQTVVALSRAIYQQYNGIQAAAGCHDEGQQSTFWLAITHSRASRLIVNFCIAAVESLLASNTLEPTLDDIAKQLQKLREMVRSLHPDYQARILIIAAIEQGISWRAVAHMPRWWQFSLGKQTRYFFETLPGGEPRFGLAVIGNKLATSQILRDAGLPTPNNEPVRNPQHAAERAASYGWPLVVKPVDRGCGRGVSTNIRSASALAAAFAHAAKFSTNVLIEQQLEGHDYRLLVVRGQLIAATRRDPPAVVGDGRQTIAALIDNLNQQRLMDDVKRRYLKQIDSADSAISAYLAQQQLNLDSVPAAGEKILLRGNANISTGGEPLDVTAQLHPDVAKLAIAVTAKFGLSIAGVDYMTRDLSRSWRDSGGAIIEVNATPGLDLHVVGGFTETALGKIILGL